MYFLSTFDEYLFILYFICVYPVDNLGSMFCLNHIGHWNTDLPKKSSPNKLMGDRASPFSKYQYDLMQNIEFILLKQNSSINTNKFYSQSHLDANNGFNKSDELANLVMTSSILARISFSQLKNIYLQAYMAVLLIGNRYNRYIFSYHSRVAISYLYRAAVIFGQLLSFRIRYFF